MVGYGKVIHFSLIFLLCMERLLQINDTSITNKAWNPIIASRGGPKISHLFFADDLVMFAEASIEKIEIIKQCLDLFCNASKERVNFEKSNIFFSKDVELDLAMEISTLSKILEANDFEKYLGIQTMHNKSKKGNFENIIDRVNHRLQGWRSKYLFFIGCVTLAKATVDTIPRYIMQSTNIPLSTCDEVDKKLELSSGVRKRRKER